MEPWSILRTLVAYGKVWSNDLETQILFVEGDDMIRGNAPLLLHLSKKDVEGPRTEINLGEG